MAVNKTHGLSLGLDKEWAEDTSHGDTFKSYTPGVSDFSVEINAWYDTAYSTLEAAAKNGLSYFFTLYIDFADSLNYYRGQMYFGLDGLDLAMGNTADFTFSGRIANADIAIVRNGAAI